MTTSSDHSAAIWALVRRQHWVVTHAQLVAHGVSRAGVKHRVASGRLHPIARGVYVVGRRDLSPHGRWMAAVLVCGPAAGLCDESAAACYGIRDARPSPIHIAVPKTRRLRRPGLVIHRRSRLDLTEWRNVPLTSPTDTLVDLAARLPPAEVEAAVNEADRLDLIDPETLRSNLDTTPPRPGVGKLMRLLDRHTFRLTDSELERRFLRIVRAARLPLPETRRYRDSFRTDFVWPQLELIVEVDGLRYHRTPAQQARDRLRDQAHTAAGRTPLRFTHAQVRYDAAYVTEILERTAARLVSAGPSPAPRRACRA